MELGINQKENQFEVENKVYFNKEDVVVVPDEMEAVITNVYFKTAFDIYGSKCRDPMKKFLQLQVQNNQHKVNTTINIAYYEKGSVPSRSNLGKFLLNYGELKVGQVIHIQRGDKGFWKAKIEDEENGQVSQGNEEI